MTARPRDASRPDRFRPVTALWRLAAAGVLALAAGSVSPAAVAAQDNDGCVRCHGELELLRQHVTTLEEARAVLALEADVDASAHTGMSCLECHTGFGDFPHPEGAGQTESCASCHEEQEALWLEGSHAAEEGAACSDCHGVHDTRTLEELRDTAGVQAMRETCGDCHEEPAIPVDDPHADSASCAGCHAPHGTLPYDDPEAWIHPTNQLATCGACHEEVAGEWTDDAHHEAVAALVKPGAEPLPGATRAEPPDCSSCHGAHGMQGPSDLGFHLEMVQECSACHEDYAETYVGTYHGKATELGYDLAATCSDCHGAHGILPTSHAGSAVAPDNLVETCGDCHENARPAFVLYDSHPDPMDGERNAALHYSFVFMNVLLVGVMGVFTLHTALWWVRLLLDKRKGIIHGIGEDHG